MINGAEFKQRAKEQIKGHIWILFAITIISTGISSGLAMIPDIGSVIASFVTPFISAGFVGIYLKLYNEEAPDILGLFEYKTYIWPAFLVSFWSGIKILLWSLLLIVPGIIAALRYSMVYYIFAEDPTIPAKEILEMSNKMTDGYKMKIFTFTLSFIGWILLCLVTFGIASIWVVPYMNMAMTNLYKELKNNL